MTKDMYFSQLARNMAAIVSEGNDRINYLEKRHELILKWLEKQSVAHRARKKEIPSPAGILFTPEGYNSVEEYINSIHWVSQKAVAPETGALLHFI